MNLEYIRNNPVIMMHLRFDLMPGEVMKPTWTKTETELKEHAGFFFCIGFHNNSPRLVLLHMLPDGRGSPDYISDFPEDMLRDAIRDAGGDDIRGFYPINKPIADLLLMGLRAAEKKRRY
jgi:hypothetical protein